MKTQMRERMSRKAFTKLQAAITIAIILCTVVIGVSIWWITKPKPFSLFDLGENAAKINIKVEAEGAVLHYREELFWSDDQFSEILQNENEFKSNLTEQFNESLSIYGERHEYIDNVSTEFNETKKSTTLKCDVHDAVSKTGNNHHATFKWLLGPLGLDFIDSGFEESKNGLSWEGAVNDIPTSVLVELPPRDSVYAAWQHPNGHCHAHAWWSE